MLVSRQATFEEIVQAFIKKHGNIPPELYDRIRLFDVRGYKDYREFQLTQAISTASLDTSYGTNFFAEPIPREEEEAGELDRFIVVIHFAKELTRLHGVPIKFVVKPVLRAQSITDFSVNYGSTLRGGYRNDWGTKIKTSQRSKLCLFLKHTITQLKQSPLKMVFHHPSTDKSIC